MCHNCYVNEEHLSKVHCVIVSFAPEEVEEEEQEEGRTLRDCLDAFFLFAFASP